jgi:hypothetical protein
MKKIVLFNGPPHCGKDTIAHGIKKLIDGEVMVEVAKFAQPLKTVAKHLYCDGNQELFDKMDLPENKGVPNDLFFGKTCREVQIAISEQYAKPVHGEKVFGKILAQHIKFSPNELFLVSDSGFRQEAEVLVEEFGAENVLLVRIKRKGTTYDGDSRGYINLEDLGVVSLEVENNSDVNGTIQGILNIMKGIL